MTRRKDGQDWVIGTEDDVRWIQEAISISSTVTSAVPPHFSAYATVLVPDKHGGRSEDLRVLLDVLGGHSGDQPWWLGYLETGTDDLVFPDAPRTRLWDDDWRSLGGPSDLVGRLLDAPLLQARRIGLDDEVAPPGHDAI